MNARNSRGRQLAQTLPVLRLAAAIGAATAALIACGGSSDSPDPAALAAQGKQIFRFDTFGDEAQWTDKLRMHEVISTGVSPNTALSVGLKVDSEALPAAVVAGIQNGSVDLTLPATTVTLLKLNAVVGLQGTVQTIGGKDTLVSVGVTCALCHSTVDNSFAPGIGKRLDGWPNRDLNPGAIIALSPAVTPAQKLAYTSWGKGMYDPRFNLDGKSKPAVIPPAFGLDGIHKVTATGDGDELAYWNRYVSVTQMGGLGTFTEPRLSVSVTNGTVDLVTSKLPALQAYQLSIKAPAPPAGSFDAAAAARGKTVFEGAGQMRDLPQRRPVHRCQHDAASGGRFDGRARDAQLRVAFSHQAVSHVAAEGCLAARALLPRRLRADFGSRGPGLQHQARTGTDAPADRRPGAVPEVAVGIRNGKARRSQPARFFLRASSG